MSFDDLTFRGFGIDTGLLVSHAFDENEMAAQNVHNRILAGDFELNEGMLVENAVAQIFSAAGRKLYFYSRRTRKDSTSRMELDFLLSRSKLDVAHNVRVVEVKSGKRATHKSLDKYCAKFPTYVEKPFLLWMKDWAVRAGVVHLPIYMAPCLVEG